MNETELQTIREFINVGHSDTAWVVFAQIAVPALLAELECMTTTLTRQREYWFGEYTKAQAQLEAAQAESERAIAQP